MDSTTSPRHPPAHVAGLVVLLVVSFSLTESMGRATVPPKKAKASPKQYFQSASVFLVTPLSLGWGQYMNKKFFTLLSDLLCFPTHGQLVCSARCTYFVSHDLSMMYTLTVVLNCLCYRCPLPLPRKDAYLYCFYYWYTLSSLRFDASPPPILLFFAWCDILYEVLGM